MNDPDDMPSDELHPAVARRLAFAADAERLLRRLLEAETFTPFKEKEWATRIADAMEEARTLLGHLDAPAAGAVLPGEMG
jgi:hypothetical protein